MNALDPTKARRLYSLFCYRHGVREAARLAGVNRGTAAAYRRKWLEYRPTLQRAYDALWEGDGEECDRINAALPEPVVAAMLDAWLDDQMSDIGIPRSGFYDGYEDIPHPAPPPAAEHEAEKQRQIPDPAQQSGGPDGERP